MDKPLYLFARLAIALFQVMPLSWGARIGRCGGGIFFWIDARHRKVAIKNLTLCFQEVKTKREIRGLAKENFRRIGENFCASIKTSGMTNEQLNEVVEIKGVGLADATRTEPQTESVIYASGHFGNYELFARMSAFIGGYHVAATYRGLRQESLNELLRSLRTVSGNIMYERRTESEALKKAMGEGGRLLVLFSDQSERDNGMELPFFGRPCQTSRAPAIMAMRYKGALFVPICYRTGLARWRIEVGEPIATHEDGVRRSVEAVTRDMNRAFEAAIEKDPANWFWVHNRWKVRANFNAVKATPALA
jgi:KDO2-lipid IV(A) lauroyltransferase